MVTCSFGKIPTLATTRWFSDKLKQNWKWRDRSMESVMQRFIDLNQENLNYLGITVSIETQNGKLFLKLVTSKYVGTIPIFSPMNGRAIGDLVVTGRFGENAEELIALLNGSIEPEYSDKFKLVQDTQIAPPIFIECCKYIDAYIEADKFKWQKFINIVEKKHQPSSSTLWNEYAIRTAKDPLEFSIYNNKCNILTTNHEEWAQLNYVLELAITELESKKVPIRTRSVYSNKIGSLKIKLRNRQIAATDKICIRMSDPFIIKKLKQLAITILNNKANEKLAWRLDYAKFFEKYVQYIFNSVAQRKGAQQINNPHYRVRATHTPPWGISYLEPDLILQKGEEQYVIDAKYKSHLLNLNDFSEDLKDTFRHDFHQILAYCSFNNMPTKKAMLVYPFKEFTAHKINVKSNLIYSGSDIYLVGVPLEKAKIQETQDKLSNLMVFDNVS